MSKNYARIVLPERTGDGPRITQGTQVWVGDQQLTGVFKIEMVAETGDLWRAVIHCAAVPQSLECDYEIRLPSLWHYVRQWWKSRRANRTA